MLKIQNNVNVSILVQGKWHFSFIILPNIAYLHICISKLLFRDFHGEVARSHEKLHLLKKWFMLIKMAIV